MAQKSWCYISVSSKLKAKIDREDLEKVSARKWRVAEGVTGRKRVVTSIREGTLVRQVTLGHFLMKPRKGKQVYPRRFNEELDYRKDNLVICTRQELQRLLPKRRKKSSSIYRGVSYSPKYEKWRANIEVEGQAMSLGYFASESDAAHAYNVAARKHFGTNSYQNQITRRVHKRRAD